MTSAQRDLRRRFRQDPLPEIQRRPGARFYVTAHSGGRTAALLGPYVSHMTALANVERGRRLALERFSHDPEVEFAAFGTASLRKTVRTRFGR